MRVRCAGTLGGGFAAAAAVLALVTAADAAAPTSDPPLFAALRADHTLGACRCMLAATWINQSYARITVDTAAWNKLGGGSKNQFAKRALGIAEATYLAEFAAEDQYDEIYIVDRRGKLLLSYQGRA